MSVWKPVLAVLLVFVAGLVAGVEGTRMIEQWHERQDAAHPQAYNQRLTDAAELQLVRQLKLGPLQRPRIRQILLEMQGQLKLINQETQPRRALVVSNAAAQIELILGPAQKRQFEILKQENRSLLPQRPALLNNQ